MNQGNGLSRPALQKSSLSFSFRSIAHGIGYFGLLTTLILTILNPIMAQADEYHPSRKWYYGGIGQVTKYFDSAEAAAASMYSTFTPIPYTDYGGGTYTTEKMGWFYQDNWPHGGATCISKIYRAWHGYDEDAHALVHYYGPHPWVSCALMGDIGNYYYCPEESGGYHYRTSEQDPGVCKNAPPCPTGQTRDKVSGKCGYPKTLGGSCPATKNPIAIATGEKYLVEPTYISGGVTPLTFTRTYSTADTNNTSRWRADPIGRFVRLLDSTTAIMTRGDGKTYNFTKAGSVWTPDADITDKLVQHVDGNGDTTGWTYTTASDEIETYNNVSGIGRLLTYTNRQGLMYTVTISDGTGTGPNGDYVLDANGNPTSTPLAAGLGFRITDPFGRSISFGRDASNRLIKFTNPANESYLYSFDANSDVVSLKYPDNSIKQYVYNESAYTGGANLPHSLTGIIDENGNRYASYYYDSLGRAIKEEHAPDLGLGIDRYELTYNVDGTNSPVSTVLTDPLGTPRTYNLQTILGVVKSTGQTQPGGAGCGASATAMTYDANGNIASRTDFNGNKTTYIYDLSRNLETSRTEGLTTAGAATPATRTIATTWHATWRIPLTVTEYAGATATGTPLKETTYTYDSKANLTSRTETDPVNSTSRTTTISHTYSTVLPALVLTKVIDGPRTDLSDTTTYSYYDADNADIAKRGNLASITNAAGQVTQFTSYNLHGQVLTSIDPNGVLTTNTYDVRQRLTSRTVGTETTAMQYDAVGQLTQLTLPDQSTLGYTYDAAHRLTQVTDNAGNKIVYTLDAIGNRIKEEIKDPQGNLAKLMTRSYDALNRLQTMTGLGQE